MDWIVSDKAAITELFKRVRAQGFFARQFYHCCGSCALSYMPQDLKRKHRAFMYTTRQNRDDFNQKSRALTTPLYLGFGSSEKDGSMTSEEAGKTIVSVALDMGLDAKWSGDTCDKVAIMPHGSLEIRTARRLRNEIRQLGCIDAEITFIRGVCMIVIEERHKEKVEETFPSDPYFKDLGYGLVGVEFYGRSASW